MAMSMESHQSHYRVPPMPGLESELKANWKSEPHEPRWWRTAGQLNSTTDRRSRELGELWAGGWQLGSWEIVNRTEVSLPSESVHKAKKRKAISWTFRAVLNRNSQRVAAAAAAAAVHRCGTSKWLWSGPRWLGPVSQTMPYHSQVYFTHSLRTESSGEFFWI